MKLRAVSLALLLGAFAAVSTSQQTNPAGAALERKVGAVFQCDRFPGADVSIKANACNAAAIAAGGGTIDLRDLLHVLSTTNCATTPSLCESEEIEVNTRAAGGAGIGVTAIFPTKGSIIQNFAGGPVIGATVYVGNGSSTTLPGYPNGCTVNVAQTAGFPFTNAGGAGAVLTVKNSGSAITGFTVARAGTGYISAKYVPTTNGTCTGSGLVVNLQAADCGVRLNNGGVIQTGSVGAGAATMQIIPWSGLSGVAGEALFCNDEGGGYVETQGGIRTANFNASASYSAGTALFRDLLDQSSFDHFETGSPHDDGARIESACCGASWNSLHADSGNTGGYPIIVGSGGVIHNACTTSGSNIITAPYAHFTAEYLGDIVRPGKAETGTNFPAGTLTITRITSLTSITVSAKATVTNSTNPTCTAAAPERGTGLTLRIADPAAPSTTQISLYHPVSNAPGPGLENILITGNVNGLSTYGAYLEANSSVDKSTAQTYIGYPAGEINFYNFFAPGPSSGATKYAIQSDTPFGWCVFGGLSSSGLLDQDVLIPPASSKNLNYCKGGMPYAVNSTNLLPDTDLKQGGAWWTIPPGVSIAGGLGASGENAFTYTMSSGTPSGPVLIPVKLPIPNLQPNRTYTAGAHVDFTRGSSGRVEVKLCSTADCSGPTYMNASIGSGATRAGIVSRSFSAASFTGPYFVIELENVKGNGTLIVSEPFLVAGNLASYTENDSGFGAQPSEGTATVSEMAGGSARKMTTPNPERVLAGACTGTAPSSANNLAVSPFGTSSSSCAATVNPLYGALMPSAGTVSGLAVRCGTTGSQPASGVFALYDYPNGGGASRPTGVTVTYGTKAAKTVVRDTTHSYAYSAGDLLVLLYSTQANETLANCAASFVY